MDSKKLIFQNTARIAAGQLICCVIMAGIFALTKQLDIRVISGAAVGGACATLNFFLAALSADAAADKAVQQDPKSGQLLIRISYLARLIGLFTVLAICAKSGIFHLLALVLPLTFTGPILTITELFYQKGGQQP